MKKTLLSLLFLAFAMMVSAATPWKNGKLKVSENSRFLQFENGKPFFWLGDTGWLLPERLDRHEAQYYLARCAKAGYNVVLVQTIDDVTTYNAYGQPSNPDGFNFKNINKPGVYGYWDHMDYIIKQAERQGIYIGMVCIWGGLVKEGLMDVKQAKQYGEFLAKRYKNSPNIIWIIGGDIQGSVKTEVWDALARSIRAIDNNHLMTYHPRGRHTSAQWFNNREWLDFNMFQSGHRRYNQRMGNKEYPIPDGTEEDVWMYVDSAWAYKPIKPVLDAEPSYENIPMGLHDNDEPRWTDLDVRRYAYWSVFAGSFGHTYGNSNIMQMAKPGTTPAYFADVNNHPWYKALDDPGFNQMQYVAKLITSFPFFDRVPDQSIIEGNGKRYERLIATRGNDYLLVYNHTGRDMTLNLTKISGKKKNVWWMDPTNGTLRYLGEYDNKTTTFRYDKRVTGVQDGVLIAIDADKNYLTKQQTFIGTEAAKVEKDRTE